MYEHAATPTLAKVHDVHRTFNSSVVNTDNATQHFGTDGSTFVMVLDEKTYLVRGEIPSADLRWSLTYHQEVDAAREHVDILGAIKLDWVSYMPSATVRGEISFQGRTYRIDDGLGYHDHNSGKWPKTQLAAGDSVADGSSAFSFDYKWGSVYGGASGVGGVYGAYLLPKPFSKSSIDYVFLRAHGKRIEFATLCGHHVHIEPLAFVDRAGGHREATAVRITAESRAWRAEWTHAVRSSALNSGGTGLGLVVYEQLSEHNLTLIAKSVEEGGAAQANGAPFATLHRAPGFTEWSNPA